MKRAQNIYKSRDVGVVDVIFEADSFDELISQLDMMERLGNSDVDTVHAITAYKRDIKDRRLTLEADQKAAARLVAAREDQKNQLIALQADLQGLTGKIKKEIKKLKYQAKLRAQLALTGYSGPIPGPVDPNSPGHPEIVSIAQRYFGVPYVWGGASPSGFDCSGLTMYCYAQIGIGMSHGATDQQRSSIPVALTDLRPGDLIFFGNASFSHHVAIFVSGDHLHRGAAHRRRGALRHLHGPRRLDRRPLLGAASTRRGRSEGPAALPPGLRRLRPPSATLRRQNRRFGGKLLRTSAEQGHGERTRATGAA